MKIVYIIQSLHNSAGMERVLINKANFFSEKLGYTVYIVTTDMSKGVPFYTLSEKVKLVDLDINFNDYANLNILSRVQSFVKKQRLYKKRLNDFLLSVSADIVVSLMLKNTTFLFRIKDNSKKIIELHFSKNVRKQYLSGTEWNYFTRLIYYFRGYWELLSFKKYDRFIVLTEEDKNMWGNKLPNISVIPNSLSFYPQQKADISSKKVISVGRLEYQKGYDLLIPIWRKVVDLYPEWTLTIYGAGSQKDSLLMQIKEMHLEQNLKILEPTPMIVERFLESSIYVMTSRFEGLPMVLLEAMACGLPGIAFKCKCGPSDIITDGVDGYLVNENDLNSFADKLLELIGQWEKRCLFSQNAKKNIIRFSEENIMNQWNKLFIELISSR